MDDIMNRRPVRNTNFSSSRPVRDFNTARPLSADQIKLNRQRRKQWEEDNQRQEEMLRKQQEEAMRNRKLSGWERFLSALGSFETGNAMYKSTEADSQLKAQGKFWGTYAGDIYRGLSDAVTGYDRDQHLGQKKTYKDLLADKYGMENRAGLDASDVLGFAGDILLDPTTYITFGAGGGAKAATSTGAKVVLTKAGTKALKKTISETAEHLGYAYLKKTLGEGAEISSKQAIKAGNKMLKEVPGFAQKYGLSYEDLVRKSFADVATSQPEAIMKQYGLKKGTQLIDQGGLKVGLPFSTTRTKTLLTPDQLAKIGLRKVGEKGLYTGLASTALDVGQKIPVAGKYVRGAREGVTQLFDRAAASGLKGTQFESFLDAERKFTTTTKSEASKVVTDFLDSAHDVVKKHRKTYKSVEGLGQAIYDYVELGKKINPEVREWVESSLKPLVKSIAKDEAEVGKLTQEIVNYLPHVRSAKYNQGKATKVFGARLLKIMAENPYDAPSETFLKFFSPDIAGKEGRFIGTALDKNLKEVPYLRGITSNLTEGETNWLMNAVTILKKRGIDVEFKPKMLVSKNALGYFTDTGNKIVIAGARPIEGLLSTLAHEMTHGAHGKLGARELLYMGFKNKGKKFSNIIAELTGSLKKEWENILKNTDLVPGKMGADYVKLTPKQKATGTRMAKKLQKQMDDIAEEIRQIGYEKAKISRKFGHNNDWKILDQKTANLIAKKADLKKEWYKAKMYSMGYDPFTTDIKFLEGYLKNPTELLSRAVQIMRENPEKAMRDFPETARIIKRYLATPKGNAGPIINAALTKEDKLLTRIVKPGQTFTDEAGNFWYNEGRAALSEANKYVQDKNIAQEVFNPNLFEAMPRRLADSVRVRNTQNFIDFIREQWGKPITSELKNKAKVWDAKNRKYVTKQAIDKVIDEDGVLYRTSNIPGLKGILLPDPIIKQFEETYKVISNPDAASEFGRAMDKIMKWWKISVTSVFPSFHIRNIIGASFNNWLAGTNPVYYGVGGKIMKAAKMKDKEAAEKVMVKFGGREYKAMDIWRMANDNGAIGTSGYLDIAKNQARRYHGNAFVRGANLVADRGPMQLTENVESFVRLPLFINELAKGSSAEEAAKTVLKYHFDYSPEALTGFERGLKKVIPFYTWTRNNIPLQLEQMSKQPGKYAAWSKIFQGQDRQQTWDDRQNMPDWMRNMPLIPMGNGKQMQLDIPIADLGRMNTKDIFGMVNPLIKAPIEIAANRNIFTGKDIQDEKLGRQYQKTRVQNEFIPFVPNDWIPEQIRKAFGMEKNEDGDWVMDSRKAYGLQAMGSRFMSTSKTLSDDTKTWQEKTAKLGAGISFYDTKKYAASTIKDRFLKQMSPEQQAVYNAIHVKMEGETPLLYTSRKAATYIDYPEFFLVDKAYYKEIAKNNGTEVNPLYNLPWDQAKQVFAQQAKGDKWNEDELQKETWYNTFKQKQSEYYTKLKESGKEINASENDPFYIKPSGYVQNQMNQKNWTDPQVQQYFEDVEMATNMKRQVIGLISEEPYNKIKDQISEGKNTYKELTGKSMAYMQAMRIAGLGYEKWFEEHPELDPLKGGRMAGSSSKKKYTKKLSKTKMAAKIKYPSDKKKKVSKAKVKKLASRSALKPRTNPKLTVKLSTKTR